LRRAEPRILGLAEAALVSVHLHEDPSKRLKDGRTARAAHDPDGDVLRRTGVEVSPTSHLASGRRWYIPRGFERDGVELALDALGLGA
jgi:hypothetical protein